ncbi:MAG: ABC transporter substrate-binding protein [Pirellulales bacterium]
MVPPPMWGYNTELVDRPFDTEAAKKKLAEYAAEKGLTLPMKLQLSVMSQARPYMPDPKSMAGFMKDSLREVGIELEIVFRDVNQHFDALMKGEHQIGLAGWNSDNSDPDNFLYSLLDSDNINDQGNNLSRYRSEAFDDLVKRGRKNWIVRSEKIYFVAQAQVFKDALWCSCAHEVASGAF